MIGVDTNILARAYLDDDKEQAKEAKNFLKQAAEDNLLFISSYTILEFAWVLKTKNYKKEEIYDTLIALINFKGVTIGQREVVTKALEKYIKGKADFGDYMITSEGEKYRSHELKTFDKILQVELSKQ